MVEVSFDRSARDVEQFGYFGVAHVVQQRETEYLPAFFGQFVRQGEDAFQQLFVADLRTMLSLLRSSQAASSRSWRSKGESETSKILRRLIVSSIREWQMWKR